MTTLLKKRELSPFQREKLGYYFRFFDKDNSGFIDLDDFPILHKDILKYTGWDADSMYARLTDEIHELFIETIKEKADHDNDGRVDLEEWLDLWSHLIYGSMAMGDFPLWLQMLPRVLFSIIDKKDDHLIDEEELRDFYSHFIGIDEAEVDDLTKEAFANMTDKGAIPLDEKTYDFVFANFLLGRTGHGPGRFVFGCFEHSHKDEPFMFDLR